MLSRRALLGSAAALTAGCGFLESLGPSVPKVTGLIWAASGWFKMLDAPYRVGRAGDDFRWALHMFNTEEENPYGPKRGKYTLTLQHKERFQGLDEFVEWLQEVDADLVTVWPVDARELAKRGVLLPLDQVGGEDEARLSQEFYSVVLDQYRESGALYALPIGAHPVMVRYDPDYFAAMGVPPMDDSWDWEDLARHAQKLTLRDEQGVVQRWGLAAHVVGLWWALCQNEAGIIDSATLRCGLREPAAVEALNFVHGLLHTQRVAPAAQYRDLWNILDSPQPPAMIYDMYHGQRFPSRYRWAELPRGKVRAAPVYGDLGIAITAKTGKADVAYTALQGLVGAMQQYVVRMPAKKEAVARLRDFRQDLHPDEIAAIQRSMEYGRFEPQGVPTNIALNRALEALVRGDDVMSAIDDACTLARNYQ